MVIEHSAKSALTQMGVLVDAVSKVLDIHSDKIEETAEFGGGIKIDYFLGKGKIKDDVKV